MSWSALAAAVEGRRVCLIAPDLTRRLPAGLLARTLAALAGARQRSLLIGLGLHRPLSPAERAPLAALAAEHRTPLILHDPDRVVVLAEDLRRAEDRALGVAALPAAFAPEAAEAELRVLLGVVEPHQYAGFSGGPKALGIGVAGRATISAMHGLGFLRDPGTAITQLAGNPFAAALARLAEAAGPSWAVQAVAGGGVHVGPWRQAHAQAVTEAARLQLEEVQTPWPALHLGVPASKGQSFYQASRAASYVALSARPAVAPGAWLLLEAACPEGLGQGAGERAFAAALQRGPERLAAELAGEATPKDLGGGAQRAYVLLKTLSRVRLARIGGPPLPALEPFGVRHFCSLAEAQRALDLPTPLPHRPDVFTRLPRLRGGA